SRPEFDCPADDQQRDREMNDQHMRAAKRCLPGRGKRKNVPDFHHSALFLHPNSGCAARHPLFPAFATSTANTYDGPNMLERKTIPRLLVRLEIRAGDP